MLTTLLELLLVAADAGLHGHVPLRQPAQPALCLLGWLLGGLRAGLPAGKLKWNSPEVFGKEKSPVPCQSKRDSPQQRAWQAGACTNLASGHPAERAQHTGLPGEGAQLLTHLCL